MIGDTAGLIHPFIVRHNGMAMAFHSAKLAAENIIPEKVILIEYFRK
jgi:flavin-dependent dehydrogenase